MFSEKSFKQINERESSCSVEGGWAFSKQSTQDIEFNKATFFYTPIEKDKELITEIRRLAFHKKKDGYRMIYRKLRRNGQLVNHKKVYRIYKAEGLKIRTKSKRRRKDLPRKKMTIPKNPNELWSMDFVHECTADGRSQRILTGIDVCSRVNTILEVSNSYSSQKLVDVLEELSELPKAFLLDNGTEFTSIFFVEWCKMKQIDLYFIEKGKPTQNAFIESFNGKLRNECLSMNYYKKKKNFLKS
jgi:putative transposase